MLVNLDQKLCFTTEITSTNLLPHLVIWLALLRHVYIIKLTVPCKSSVEEDNECKKLRYMEVAANAKQQGWKVRA